MAPPQSLHGSPPQTNSAAAEIQIRRMSAAALLIKALGEAGRRMRR